MPNSTQQLRIADYTYELPDQRIARYPAAERDDAKLLIYKDKNIAEDRYRSLDQYLEAGTMLVFNDTKVIPARLQFVKDSGGVVEIFCLEPLSEPVSSMTQRGHSKWKCLVGGAKKWKSGPLTLENGPIRLDAFWEDKENHIIRFEWLPDELTFAEVLDVLGAVPLPPYLARPVEADDRTRYQTIYARYDGSVAAPTAGLHFTQRIFDRLTEKGIARAQVTLHVGAGTFKPVKSEVIGDHDMHAEYFDVPLDTIKNLYLQYQNGNVVAVGTTTLRTLESLFLMGSKLLVHPDQELPALEIKQWDAYAPEHAQTTVLQAFEALINWMETRNLDRMVAKTQLLIAPGYRVRTIQALVTNFHQPNSTLLLLVAAIVGADWRRIYQYALDGDFRFLSYGDGSILFLS
jgi:S-adenosylmethionine:tRNA ribosyltransferase-isomerase